MQLPYIQLPQSQAPQIIGDMGNTLIEAAQRKQQQEQQAIQNLMQQQRLEADQARMRAEENRAQAQEHRATIAATREQHQYEAQQAAAAEAALEKVHAHLQAGDTGSAEALAQAHGIKMQQRPLAMDPGAAPGTPQAPAEQGPIPSPEERALSMAQPGAGGNQAPAAEQAISEDQRMLGERQQYAQALADHPRLVAEHQAHQQAFQQAKQNPVYDIETPYGKSTFDLGAEKQHQLAQREQQATALTEGLPHEYQMQASALIKGGVPAVEVTREIQARRKADEEHAFKKQQAAQYQTTAGQKFQIGMANAGSRRLSATAAAGSKEDAAAARAQGTLEKGVNDVDKMVDWKGLAQTDNTVRALQANMSGNTLQKRDAQIQLARIFRGTTPTEGEMHLLYNNLGGTMDKWSQFVAKLETGGLSPEQEKQLHESTATTVEELQKRKERALGAIRTRLGPGSGMEMLGPQVNQIVKSHGQAVGVDVPDIYDPQQTGGGAVLLGSKAKKAKGGEKLLTDMAKMSKLAPEDRDMAQKARTAVTDPKSSPERKKNAQAVLDHLGL